MEHCFSHISSTPHHPFNGGDRQSGSQISRHLSELKIIDEQLAYLIEWMKRSESRDRLWLVISSDHGQGFGRHHVRTHNGPPYEHQARVPMWVYYAGGKEDKSQGENSLLESSASVAHGLWTQSQSWSSIDLHPTLLELFGVAPNGDSQGVSWWPYWRQLNSSKRYKVSSLKSLDHSHGPQSDLTSLRAYHRLMSDRPLLSVNWYTRAIYDPKQHLKLIEDTRSQTLSLFDLKRDPRELTNRCDLEQSRCREMKERLDLLLHYGGGRQPIDYKR